MQYKADLDARGETMTDGKRVSFALSAGCCRERRVDERGWRRTCGHVIATPEAVDSGIPSLLRMSRDRLAQIKPRWTAAASTGEQLGLALCEQDRAEDWTEDAIAWSDEEWTAHERIERAFSRRT